MKTFREFWPYYLNEHSNPLTRRLHFVGTTLSLCLLGYAILKREPIWIFAALMAGYGPAWVAHFFVEKNRPATFKHPVWSLVADFKMWFFILTRRKLK